MGMSEYIIEVIEKNRRGILNDIPIEDLIYALRAEQVLNDGNVEKLEDISDIERLRNGFLVILQTKEDKDFYQFCKLLQESQVTTIEDFGRKLKEEAIDNNKVKEQI